MATVVWATRTAGSRLRNAYRGDADERQLDFAGLTGRMLAALLLALGEMEQETRGERQRAGIEAITANPALRRRKFRGRKKGATKGGIRANKPGRVVALREKGLTFPEIATALGVGLSTAKRYVYEHVREEGASSPG